MELQVLKMTGASKDKIVLSEGVFAVEKRPDLVARTVRWQLAKRRQGTHAVKGRSDVSGSTRKIVRQKGSGGARHGSIRAPQFRGGGVVFGPVVRDHSHDLPKKVRKLALKSILSDRLRHNRLFVMDFSDYSECKTKDFLAAFENLNLGVRTVLIIDGAAVSSSLQKAVANISWIDCLPQIGSNVYDIIRKDAVILTPEAVKLLEERLK